MGNVIADVLPLAIAIALSPFPIIGLILILFTKKARMNSLVFLLGWFTGLAVFAAIVFALFYSGRITVGTATTENGASVIKLLIGLTLIYLGYREWQKRPKEGEEVETPKWMSSVDSIGAGGAFLLGAFLSGVNPKNLLLNIGATIIIAQAMLPPNETLIVALVYILLASVTIVGTVIYYQFAGAKAEEGLTSIKAWLIQNNTAVMAVLLLVFGVKFTADFIGALF